MAWNPEAKWQGPHYVRRETLSTIWVICLAKGTLCGFPQAVLLSGAYSSGGHPICSHSRRQLNLAEQSLVFRFFNSPRYHSRASSILLPSYRTCFGEGPHDSPHLPYYQAFRNLRSLASSLASWGARCVNQLPTYRSISVAIQCIPLIFRVLPFHPHMPKRHFCLRKRIRRPRHDRISFQGYYSLDGHYFRMLRRPV